MHFLFTAIISTIVCQVGSLPSGLPNEDVCIKSVHEAYLRNANAAMDSKEVGLAEHCEPWSFSDGIDSRISIRTTCPPGNRYLGAIGDGQIRMGGSKTYGHSDWQPRKNQDGSWSFVMVDRERRWWLSADRNGSIYTTADGDGTESNFWIEQPKDAWSAHPPPLSELPCISGASDGKGEISSSLPHSFAAVCITSIHGTFLEKVAETWKSKGGTVDVRAASVLALACVEAPRRKGRVAFRNEHTGDRLYLRRGNGSVGLDAWPVEFEIREPEIFWTPHENRDGSWSFQAMDGEWMSVSDNGSVQIIENGTETSSKFRLVSPIDSWNYRTTPASRLPPTTTRIPETAKIPDDTDNAHESKVDDFFSKHINLRLFDICLFAFCIIALLLGYLCIKNANGDYKGVSLTEDEQNVHR